jgi:hypothetical protein
MAKITDVKIPGVGSGNVLKLETWTSLILGVAVLIIGAAAGQNVAKMVGAKVPMVDTSLSPFTSAEVSRKEPLSTKTVY